MPAISPPPTPPGPKSNIATVSSKSIRSARLATVGSLVHSLLYGSSSSPHLARSIFLSDNFFSQVHYANLMQSASYYMTGQMSHTTSHTDHISFKSMSQSSHMFGRSLRFASYFWIDVILMHAKLLFNLSWKLCVFSILQGLIVSLVLQSHGYFPTFKLKLRLPPFRLRGRIREIT